MQTNVSLEAAIVNDMTPKPTAIENRSDRKSCTNKPKQDKNILLFAKEVH